MSQCQIKSDSSLLVSLLVLAFGVTTSLGCSEKKSAPTDTNKPKPTGTSTDSGDDDDDDDDDDDPSICDSVVKDADVPSALTNDLADLCNEYKGDLTDESNTFASASETSNKDKIIIKNEDSSASSLSFVMLGAIIAETTPKAYFNMNKLRQQKPDVFAAEDYKFTPGNKICKVRVTGGKVKYESADDDQDDPLHFEGEANFFSLGKKMYMTTNHVTDDLGGTLKALRSITIIAPKNGKTIAYSYAFQEIDKVAISGTPDADIINTSKSRLLRELRNNFDNIDKAVDAEDHLTKSSTPLTSCD